MPSSAIGQVKCEPEATLLNLDRCRLSEHLEMFVGSLLRHNLALRDLTDVPLNLARVSTTRTASTTQIGLLRLELDAMILFSCH